MTYEVKKQVKADLSDRILRKGETVSYFFDGEGLSLGDHHRQWLLDFHKSTFFEILAQRLGFIKMLKISEKSSPRKNNHRAYYK